MNISAESVATSFDPRRNSLNALRLILAGLVIVSHSWPIGGYGRDPGFDPLGHGDQDLGDLAVAGFFAISGFLITASRLSSRSLVDYFWRRLLRIYPAFLVCLMVVAFGFAPLVTAILGAGRYTLHGGVMFVVNNLALLMRQFDVPNTLQTVPFPGAWDGALWTLFYEFLCYVGIGILVTVVSRRQLSSALAAAFICCAAVTIVATFTGVLVPDRVILVARLGSFFIAGAMVYLHQDRIRLSGGLAALSALALAVALATGTFSAFAGPFVACLMMYLGTRLPLQSIGARNDISYGMYIYAFPVQQTLWLVFPHLPVGVFILLALVFTVPLAMASWFVVERPAMRLKHLTAGRVPLHHLDQPSPTGAANSGRRAESPWTAPRR